MFERLGVQIVEQDVISREVVEPGTKAHAQIVKRFGSEILKSDGFLNRELLREKIFENPGERRWLEHLLHPLIGIRTMELVEQATSPYVIVVNPLLGARSNSYDCILVVDVPTEVQIQRIVERDGISTKLAQSMIAAQIDRSRRLSLADVVIENIGTEENLVPIVRTLHEKFLAHALRNAEKLVQQ